MTTSALTTVLAIAKNRRKAQTLSSRREEKSTPNKMTAIKSGILHDGSC